MQASIIAAFLSFSLELNHFLQLPRWTNWQSEGAAGFTIPGTANGTKKVREPASAIERPHDVLVRVFRDGAGKIPISI